MKLPQFSLLALLWLVLVACGCSANDSSPHTATSAVPCQRSVVLANLPENTDQRCLGIAIVMEALLGTESLEAEVCLSAQSVADRLYVEAASAGPGPLPQFIDRDGVRTPLLSRTGLEWLSTLVADRYKQDHLRAVAAGAAKRLASAMTTFVPSTEQLRSLLRADSDQTVAFGGVGARQFPSGEELETLHAFVLQIQSDGQIIVHDPNDPQALVPCHLDHEVDRVLAEWTCRYRDTGLVTTQTYRLVPMKAFLLTAFVTEEESNSNEAEP